jgi:predicted amidohydrolase
VLRGRRVIDPESGLDAVRDLAIVGDRVAARRARKAGLQPIVVIDGPPLMPAGVTTPAGEFSLSKQ